MKNLLTIIVFAAIASGAFSQKVIRGEYFIDSDPGFGNATGFAIALPDSGISQSVTIPFASFPGAGFHYVYFRTKDEYDSWSLTSRNIVEAGDNMENPVVLKVEYFFNNDNGFGNNSFLMPVATTDDSLNFNIPYADLPSEWKANDTLFFRIQEDIYKSWSLTISIDSLNFVMVGNTELKELTGVSVYPNPFTDMINISLNGQDKKQLVLYNNQGQVITEKQVENNLMLNTQNLSPGVYVVVIYAENKKPYGSKILKK